MLVAQYVLRFGVLLGLAFAASGCAGNDFSALKSLPPFGYIGFCVHHPRDCEDGSDHPARLALTPARWQELKRINGEVNALPEISDQENYGAGNIWSYPDAKGGDCEDMAMEKQRRLMAAGWPGDALLIATAANKDGEGHAVLIAAMKEGDLVLDNLDTTIRLWSETPYRWRAPQSSRRPYIWLNADPTRIALTPHPDYLPLGAAALRGAGRETERARNHRACF